MRRRQPPATMGQNNPWKRFPPPMTLATTIGRLPDAVIFSPFTGVASHPSFFDGGDANGAATNDPRQVSVSRSRPREGRAIRIFVTPWRTAELPMPPSALGRVRTARALVRRTEHLRARSEQRVAVGLRCAVAVCMPGPRCPGQTGILMRWAMGGLCPVSLDALRALNSSCGIPRAGDTDWCTAG